MSWWVAELRLFFVALQFLTRVPVPRWVGHEPGWLNRCVRYFPLVGALVGAFGAVVMLAASRWWPPTIAAVLAVTATVWLTGAFHEDGLADTFDALGGAVPRDRALAIMKDSRIGTYGATALVLVLGLRVALIATLLQRGAAFASIALIGAHVAGRGCAVALMATLPYAGDAEHAKARPLATAVPGASAVAAVVMVLLMVAGLGATGLAGEIVRWIVVVFCSMFVLLAMRAWLAARLGGYTGDTLGATEQLTEVAVLMALAAA
ncbi:MAG: adenosylcobinamide-GDP ribazoletransferase [Burkholderiales bacterium]|jgi:adenosylcobinamide-GDP ribazoletransferase|nr:adenosylcobinamide-GDP ribazoletransferase [Burkholderiales bacterium]